jgi:hypothetical protein
MTLLGIWVENAEGEQSWLIKVVLGQAAILLITRSW